MLFYRKNGCKHTVFTSLHCMRRRGLAMRILSVRLSVKRVHCDETEESSVQNYTIRKII